jgi:iron complex outermembrane receptor protein
MLLLCQATAVFGAPDRPPNAEDADEPIQLPVFSVREDSDIGYRASNSVSATRVDTPIKDLPFSLSAFTGQFMADIGARDLDDVVQYAAGATNAGRNYLGGDALYSIRGFPQAPQRDGFVTPNSGGVLTGPYVDTQNIERVEVVKGPASVLYGQVAPGGIVNYVTKKPTGKRFANLTQKIGSYGYLRSQADINQPLGNTGLSFRFNGSWENLFQYIDSAESKTSVVDPVLRYTLNDRVSLTVGYERFRRRETPQAQNKPLMEVTNYPGSTSNALSSRFDTSDIGTVGYFPGLSRTFNLASIHDLRSTNYENVNAELDVKLSEHWNSRANYAWFKQRMAFKLTGAFFVYVAPAGTSAAQPATRDQEVALAQQLMKDPWAVFNAGSPVTMQRRQIYQETFGDGESFQVETAGNYATRFGHFKPLFGALYASAVSWTRNRQSPTSAYPTSWNMLDPTTWNRDTDFNPVDAPFTSYTRAVTHNKGAYAVLNADFFSEKLYTVAGIRYSRVDSQSLNYLSGTNGSLFEAAKSTPQAGIGYKITKDVMLYANYSTSFQQNAAFLSTDNVITGPAKPTISEGYEVGVKTDFLGGKISTTFSLYDIYQDDRVVNLSYVTTGGLIVTNTIQGTRDRSRGVDFEINYSATDHLQIYASFAEDDVSVKKVPVGYDYYLGSHPEASAKTLANLWARYNRPFNVKGLWFGAGFNHVGKKAMRNNNKDLFLPSYTLFNAALGYDWVWQQRPLTFTLNWSNLTNEEYFPATQTRGLPSRVVAGVTIKL